jgi:hypothetical protein
MRVIFPSNSTSQAQGSPSIGIKPIGVSIKATSGIFESPRLAHIGKLGLKEEPAGKVRVFAMVDA